LEDFDYQDIQQDYKPYILDPGCKQVFTAVSSGLNGVSFDEIKRCSTRGYYLLSRLASYALKLKNKKDDVGLTAIESIMPSCKTLSVNVYDIYATYTISHISTFFSFNGSHTAQDRFFLCQGRQKVAEIIVDYLVNSGKKYNRKRRRNNKKNQQERTRRRRGKKKMIKTVMVAATAKQRAKADKNKW
jgi:hypothetical protein